MGKPRLQEKVTGEDVLRMLESDNADKGEIGKRRIVKKRVSLTPAGVFVPHGLGVEPQGWLAIRIRAKVSVGYPREGKVTTSHLQLFLDGNAICDIMIW